MPVLAETIPAGPGLSSSRYAPAKYQPKATSTKSSAASASTSAVASPKPVNGLPAVVEEELHASKGMMEGWIETIYIAKDNVLAGTPLTASKNGHLAVERAKSVAGRKDSVVAVTAPTTPTVEKKLVGYIDSSSPPATPEPQTPTQEHFIDLTVVDNGASKDARFFTPASGDDTEFATIDDDYTAVMDNYSGDFVDDFDFDDDEVIAMPKKKVGKEGIMADGTVYGGPYFLAAIIAAAPYIGNPSLDM